MPHYSVIIEYFIQVERGHQQNSVEVLSDFCDGSHFRSHPMFATHSKSLQIFLYYDDIEMCNPLGSHTKKHKLGKGSVCAAYMSFCVGGSVDLSRKLMRSLCVYTPYLQVSSISCLATFTQSIGQSSSQSSWLLYVKIDI